MKRIPLALLAVLSSATAQIPSVAPQPSGQAVVTGKSESDSGLSITLDQGRSTMTKAGQLSAAEVKAFRQLQVGRAYTFPEAFHLPADDSAEFTQLPLQALEKRSRSVRWWTASRRLMTASRCACAARMEAKSSTCTLALRISTKRGR